MLPSTGFQTLIAREYYRFARLSKQTIAPPIVTNLLYIFIFGFSLGSRIREINGFPYIIFILPGLALMGVITNSYANTSTSLFMARMDRSIENILASPLSPTQIVSAFVVGGMIRGILIGWVSLLLSLLIVHMPLSHFLWTFVVVALTSVIFSCLGIISALWSESWDHIATFTNFFMTPFIYLGGVFYSIQMLPPIWKKVSMANPIFYLVDALRWGCLGRGDVPFYFSIGVVSAWALVSFLVCWGLFRRGYKLVL
jgi:ABC-2 type transport system permease protein